MPESTTDVDRALQAIDVALCSVAGKLNVLARAIGGPALKREWDKIEAEAGVPEASRTFRARPEGVEAR